MNLQPKHYSLQLPIVKATGSDIDIFLFVAKNVLEIFHANIAETSSLEIVMNSVKIAKARVAAADFVKNL